MIPRYAQPTKSTSLYSYTNRDQDLIKQGFRAGNFTFLARFPSRITPFGITEALKASSRKSIISKPRTQSVRKVSPGYEWMPDSYHLKQDYLKRLREDSVKKRRSISRRDFVPSGTPSRMQEREASRRSYVSINCSFSSAPDQASRLKWIRDTQIKHGSFRAGRSLDSNQNRSNLQTIITVIRQKISKDWESTDFDIGVNHSECIEVRFHASTIENAEALHYYMGILINKTQEIGKFGLKKMQNKWGVKTGTYLVYIIAPAWVKTQPLLQSLNLKKSLVSPANRRRKTLWSTPNTHISTRNSSVSIH